MTTKSPLALTALLLIASLGACSPSTEAPPPADNSTEARPEPAETLTPTAPETRAPDPAPSPTGDANVTAALPERAPAPAPDEQLLDDASATGMTARTTRGEQTNQAAPAEPTETSER